MRYIDEYRNPELLKKIVSSIQAESTKEVRLMEVCGTHTVAIFRSGIKNILPKNISLISGPGCPVCVTPNLDIDTAIEIAKLDDVIFTTFGDMIRVPGSFSNLENERANGADVRVVYSSLDALNIANHNPDRKVVFFGIGFETTSPTIASAILSAQNKGVRNFFVLSSHKLIPPAMKMLLEAGEVKIDGFICPGHVSTIIGSKVYDFIAEEYNVPCAIAGFEPIDILQAILMLIRQINDGKPKVEIGYSRAVRPEGNITALNILNDVFDISDARWRGFGIVPSSGLTVKDKYCQFDAKKVFIVNVEPENEPKGCLCGEVLRGVKTPIECAFFANSCTPDNPIGPCMVSSEGTCSSYFKYGKYSLHIP
ncbi:TPA: hydrogenase formation protein HypD [bacterium]|nr:hydrogenase formation protein HypD [bacterium]